jgi:Skp family chaperone for outer membrane proteins
VKRHLAIIVMCGAIAAAAAAPAAAQQAPAGPATHVAVVDIGLIFKQHERFKTAMDKMRDEVMQAENGLKAERDRINGLVEQLKGFNVGSPEFKKLEAEVAKAQGDFNVTAQLQKKDFMDREAQVYLQVYKEIESAVEQFAKQHRIAAVFRFDGEPTDESNRENILRGITKPIVYYDTGIDITNDILKMLNGANVASRPAAQPQVRQ